MQLDLTCSGLRQADFDLHGIVGIRLLDASPPDVATVVRQLGPIHAPLTRAPDIVIRFVDHLQAAPVRYLGLADAGFTDDAFLVLRSKHLAGVKVQLPFDRIGKGCEIVCERAAPAVPLLIPIINLIALANGAVPLHASAFAYEGTEVVTTGWSKGGKTETLLAFTAHGARYIADEWVYISGDGRRIYGIPEPIRLWDWHLRDLGQYRRRSPLGARTRLKALRLLHSTARAILSAFRKRAAASAMNHIVDVLGNQLYIDIHPERLFGNALGRLSGSFDQLFFVASHESRELTVRPIVPEEVAERMRFSLRYERQNFMAAYKMFRFAFPEAENPLIEQADALLRQMLLRALRDKPAYAVYHPYPMSIPALFGALRPLVGAS